MFRSVRNIIKNAKAAEVYIWVVLFMRCTMYLFSTYKV